MEATTEEKQAAENALDKEMVEVKVKIFKPYIDFMKEYLTFFGSNQTLEELCRTIICDMVKFLYQELHEFAEDSTHFIEKGAWFKQNTFLACVSCPDDEEENQEES